MNQPTKPEALTRRQQSEANSIMLQARSRAARMEVDILGRTVAREQAAKAALSHAKRLLDHSRSEKAYRLNQLETKRKALDAEIETLRREIASIA